MSMAKVFLSGGKQGILLPPGFQVRTRAVFLKKVAEGFLVMERDPWELFAEGCHELSADFMRERVQSPRRS
jgi:hypothetical protein